MRFAILAAVLLALGLALGAGPAPAPAQDASAPGYAKAKVELASQRVDWLRAMLGKARRMHAEGEASDTDLAQLEARLAHARAELARYRGQLRRAEAEYESTVGQPPPGSDEPR